MGCSVGVEKVARRRVVAAVEDEGEGAVEEGARRRRVSGPRLVEQFGSEGELDSVDADVRIEAAGFERVRALVCRGNRNRAYASRACFAL